MPRHAPTPSATPRYRALILAATWLLAAAAPFGPQPRPNKQGWMERHEQKVDALHAGPVGLVFYGDSITEELEDARFGADASDVWRRYYACRQGVNLGFGGDATPNLLWRIDNGEGSGFSPKLAIIMIGTNDTRPRITFDPDDVTQHIIAVVDDVHRHLPGAKILLLGIPPNGRAADNQQAREAVNQGLAAHDWGSDDATFLSVDAPLSQGGGADLSLFVPVRNPMGPAHLTDEGWQRLAAFIEPTVRRLAGPGDCAP